MKLFRPILLAFAAVVGVNADNCTLTGTYVSGTNVSACSTVTVDSLTVPAGVTLDFTKTKKGATIVFKGTTTFGAQLWDGPLVTISGTNITVQGDGVLDGQGAEYWSKFVADKSIVRPVFIRLWKMINSTMSGLTFKNMPYRTFSVLNSNDTTISGLTLDARDGNGVAKNTDGFDLSQNSGITITGNRIYNQDDCLAMQSSTNTVFSNNYCSGGHGISIGSLGGTGVTALDTVNGLVVENNRIVDSENGIRIKTIIALDGLVQNATYRNNMVENVNSAIVIRSDYNKSEGGYSGQPTSLAAIKDIVIDGLSGSAGQLYDVFVNPDVVSDWSFSNVAVRANDTGSCQGQPSGVSC